MLVQHWEINKRALPSIATQRTSSPERDRCVSSLHDCCLVIRQPPTLCPSHLFRQMHVRNQWLHTKGSWQRGNTKTLNLISVVLKMIFLIHEFHMMFSKGV